jgi:hypothetical protein
LLAVVLVVAQLGGLLHRAVIEHVACPEHGELVHGDPAAHGRGASGIAAAPDRARQPAVQRASAPDAQPGHAHEHCCLWASPKIHTLSPGPWQAPPARLAVSPLPLPERGPEPRGAIYLIAPKHSPPAA